MGWNVAWVLTGAMAISFISVAAPAQQTEPATQLAGTQPAATQAAVDPHWQDVFKALGSAEFGEREAAQKELDRATFRDRDMLLRLAATTTDEEVKGRIMARVDAIDEELALNPAPISLTVKNASMGEVGRALSKALGGVKIQAWPDGPNGRGDFYDLNVKEKPFWDVYMALARQHGIFLQGYDGLNLNQQEPGCKNGVILGSIAVFPMSIIRSKNVNLQEASDKQVGAEGITLQYTVAIDPRVRMSRVTPPQLLTVVDDNGNVLLKVENQRVPSYYGGNTPCVFQQGTGLTIPEKLGKKIVSAKGEFCFVAVISEEKIVVNDVEKKLKQPIEIAGQTMVIDQFNVKDTTVNFNVTRKQGPVARVINGINDGEPQGVGMAFIDSTGQKLWSTTVQGSHGGGIGANHITPPVHIEFTVPTKTKQVTIPFELKDLPLP